MTSCIRAVALAMSIVGGLLTPWLRAQAPAPTTPAFEVASVKRNTSGAEGTGGNVQGGRVTMINILLRLLIRNTYQLVQDSQIVNAPDWISTERFDIVAKAAGNVSPPRPGNPGPVNVMMRSLLADRFKLVVHHETRELASYALEVARRDGKLGPQLHASTVDCAAITAARQQGGGPPPEPPGNKRPQCGFRATGGRATSGQMMAGGFPLAGLATVLSQMLQRVVIDKTGLTGDFDFELNWTPDQAVPGPPSAAIDQNGPSMFTALREQLGLRLRSTRGPVDVIVIDHVEHPTPD